MANIIVDNSIEFLKDQDTGDLVGYKRSDGTERGVVTSQTNPLTGNIIKNIWNGTQAQYDAIAVKDDSTLYVIV